MALYSTPDVPGGASKLERFFFPTDASRVPPTNEAAISQEGVEPGIPEPDADNVSDAGVTVGVVGRLRQDAASNPTIRIQSEDFAAVTGREYTVADIESGRITVEQFLAARTMRNRAAVPRFSIRRTDLDEGDDAGQVGVDPAWTLFQEIDVEAPGRTAAPYEYGPAFCKDAAGNLLIAWVSVDTPGGDPHVVVYRYKPHEATTFAHLLTIDVWAESGTAGSNAFDVEFLRRGADVYLLLGSNTLDGGVLAFLLRGTDGDSASSTFVSAGLATRFDPLRVAATDTTGGALVAVQQIGTRGILFGHSQDLRTWDTVSGDAAGVAFSEIRKTRALNAGFVTDVFFSDANTGWATTFGGEILSTTNGGQTWAGEESPADGIRNAAQEKIPLYSIARSGTTMLAVGDDGIVLKSTDTGTTWSVVRYTRGRPGDVFEAGQYNATECAKKDIRAARLYKVKMLSATRAWIVGSGASIYYTSDGGTTWTEIQSLDTEGAYTDFIVDDAASANVLLAVGTRGVHRSDPFVTAAEQDTLAVIVTNADNSSTPAFTRVLTAAEAGDDYASATAITIERNGDDPDPIDAASVGYVLTDKGRVLRFEGTGTSVGFTSIAQLPEGGRFGDLHSPDQATGGAAGELVVVGLFGENTTGYVYQTTDADSGDLDSTPSTFVAQVVAESPTAIWAFDVDKAAIGTTRGMWRATEGRNFRQQPDLVTLADGTVLYACNNSDKGWTEIYRAERPAPGEFPAFRLVHTIALQRDGFGDPINRAPRFAEYIDGSVILAIGLRHYAGLGSGRVWVDAETDARIPTPLSDIAATATYTDGTGAGSNASLRSNRALIEYNGGLLFSAVPSNDGTKIGIHRAWRWVAGSEYYRPIVHGVPMSLGVDGVRAVFTGDPAPRDVWTVRPRYLYRASHLATDSPSAEVWRSTADGGEVVIEYDAQDAAVTDALGARTFWSASFFGLFGTNFYQAQFSISDPGNAASFTTKDVTVALDTGTATGPGSAVTSNILKVAGKTWTPGQWADGPRTYYVAFVLQGVAYRIIANGADWLEVDGAVDLSGGSLLRACGIYGDRICWRGDAGTGPGSAGLLGTDYQHGRIIKATIPAQYAPGGYYQAGRFFIGQEVAPGSEARSFLYGLKFRPVTNTEQDVSKGGVKSVRHYGRTGRIWEVQFAHETADALGRKLGPLLAKMREPFVIAWNGDDMNTCTLVRLVDAAEIAGELGDNRWSSQWLLEEVL